jgi:uncharacterized FlaG/YvyC family protein
MSDYSISSLSSVRVVETAQASTPASQGNSAVQGAPVLPGAQSASSAPAVPVTSTGAIPSLHGRADQTAAKQGAQAPGQVETVVVQKHAPQKTEEEKKAAEALDKNNLPIKDLNKVTIRFSVDDKTNNITVYVIDKASKRVLRAIPPEDLNKMAAGDLLQLMA